MATGDTVCNHSLGDTSSHGTLHDCSNRVHGTDNLGLILWWDVELDLLEEVFRGTKTTNNQDILKMKISKAPFKARETGKALPEAIGFVLGWQ